MNFFMQQFFSKLEKSKNMMNFKIYKMCTLLILLANGTKTMSEENISSFNINNIPSGTDIFTFIQKLNQGFNKWINRNSFTNDVNDYTDNGFDYTILNPHILGATYAPPAGTQFIAIMTDYFPFNDRSARTKRLQRENKGEESSDSVAKHKQEKLDDTNNKPIRYKRLDNVHMTSDKLNYSLYAALNLHNNYRSLHANTNSLALHAVLNQIAQNYSYQLAYVINNSTQYNLVHSYNSRFGENLFLYCQYGTISNVTLMSKLKPKFDFK
jgi:hypothetical protein